MRRCARLWFKRPPETPQDLKADVVAVSASCTSGCRATAFSSESLSANVRDALGPFDGACALRATLPQAFSRSLKLGASL